MQTTPIAYTAPAYEWNSSFYNPGAEGTINSFISSLSSMLNLSDDPSAVVETITTEFCISEDVSAELFAELSSYAASNELSSLSSVTSAVSSLSSFVNSLLAGEIDYEKYGTYDSLVLYQMAFAVVGFEMTDNMKADLKNTFLQMINGTQLGYIDDNYKTDYDENEMEQAISSVAQTLLDKLQISAEDIQALDANLYSVLFGGNRDEDSMESAIECLKSGDFMEKIYVKIDEITSMMQDAEISDQLAESYNDLSCDAILPAVSIVASNVATMAMTKASNDVAKEIEESEKRDEKALEKAEKKHISERKSLMKESAQKSMSTKKAQLKGK